jgi:uncharacterized protein (DUF433 family)
MSAQSDTQPPMAGNPVPAPTATRQLASQPTLNDYISIQPDVRFGKPCIAGTRIAVIDIATWHNQLGYPPELIAAKWNLTVAGVHAALAYYFDHREEIDQRQAEDIAFAELSRQQQRPSKLDRILAEREGGTHRWPEDQAGSDDAGSSVER